jgi:hypothetical protein
MNRQRRQRKGGSATSELLFNPEQYVVTCLLASAHFDAQVVVE